MAGEDTAGEGRAGGSGQPAAPSLSALPTLWLWRHPRPDGAAGRCIGQTDLPVNRRRAKRLAHRIRATARREGLPRAVWTSPLRRCADVGRWLARWGWRHHIDARLMELHFGVWDGQPWSAIAWGEVQAWEADFTRHAPGGGESLATLAQRVSDWVTDPAVSAASGSHAVRLLVAHAGVMQLLQRADAPVESQTGSQPHPAQSLATRMCVGLTAASWPRPPRYGELRRVTVGLA